MMRMLTALIVLCCTVSVARAQYSQTENTRSAAPEGVIKEILTEDVAAAAQPLNNKIDYIAARYDAGDLKALIRNYEKTNKKIAARKGTDYVPYDRKIDVTNPQKVKRYLRKRVDIVF